MKTSLTRYYGTICFVVLGFFTSGLYAQDQPVDFQKTIQPLFEKYCVSCHGEETTEAFRIDVKDDVMDYVEASNADESQLYQVLVTDDENELMPPPDEDNPLSEQDIELVKLWINQGAKWTDTPVVTDPPPQTSQDQTPAGQESPVPPDNEPPKQAKPAPPQPADNTPQAAVGDQRIYRAIGSLHPATVHLPIGLLLAAGFFALLSLRGNFVMSDCAYYCLWIGALGCLVACATGWFAAPMKFRSEGINEVGDLLNTNHRVFWHRTGGLALAVLSIVLAMFAASARNRDPDDGLLWKLGLILLACGVGWVGYEGGKLTYGKYHYRDLNDLASEWFPSVFGPPAPLPNDAAPNTNPESDGKDPAKPEPDSVEGIGDTSGET